MTRSEWAATCRRIQTRLNDITAQAKEITGPVRGALDELRNVFGTRSGLQVAEHVRPILPHALGVALHDGERGADVRREINLVDHQEVEPRDAGPPLRGIFSPCATSIT